MHGANASLLLWEKVMVIKTLPPSKLMYLFVNLPDPSGDFLQEFNILLFQFLLDGKPSKIARKFFMQFVLGLLSSSFL